MTFREVRIKRRHENLFVDISRVFILSYLHFIPKIGFWGKILSSFHLSSFSEGEVSLSFLGGGMDRGSHLQEEDGLITLAPGSLFYFIKQKKMFGFCHHCSKLDFMFNGQHFFIDSFGQ